MSLVVSETQMPSLTQPCWSSLFFLQRFAFLQFHGWISWNRKREEREGGRGKEKEREKEERRSQKEKRRKAIEARLSSSGFNSPRPFPCSPWHSSSPPLPSVLGEFLRNAQLGWVSESSACFPRSWQSFPIFTARCYACDPASSCLHLPAPSASGGDFLRVYSG